MIYNYKNKGFSFVEISIVCFILLVLLIPIFTLMSRGSSGTVRNRNEILARQYASNVIAYCNGLAYDDNFLKVDNGIKTKEITELTIKDIPNHDNINIELAAELGQNASKTITITDFEKSEKWPYRYKLINVNVVWLQAGETKPRNVTMSGLVRE